MEIMVDNIGPSSTPYSCPEQGCNKSYRGINSLNLHLKKIHNQGPPKFICDADNCSKGFYTLDAFRVHKRVHGEGLVLHICKEPGCEKSFSSISRLHQHQRLHKGTAFLCSYCSKEFGNQSDKKKHERVHSGEKPYKCKECGQSFKVPHHLREHERKHTDERPHICSVPGCGVKYRRAESLRKHLSSRHPDMKSDGDLTTFLSSLGIKTISDILKHDSLRNAIDELRPNGLDMLAELAATTDICRCDPCLCDPNIPNSMCNCIIDTDTTLRTVDVTTKAGGCCGSKGMSCCSGKKTSITIATPTEIPSKSCCQSGEKTVPISTPYTTAISCNNEVYSSLYNQPLYSTASTSNPTYPIAVRSTPEMFSSSYYSSVSALASVPTYSVSVASGTGDIDMLNFDDGSQKEKSIGTGEPIASVARPALVESSTQYEDPELADLSFSNPRSPWTPCEQATDTWDLSMPREAHTQGKLSRPCADTEVVVALDLTSRKPSDCDYSALDVSMLPSPQAATPRISDHEELNGMCSDGIQTTCCSTESCTKPGILGLCNKECNIFDSGCNEPNDEGSCALKPSGCGSCGGDELSSSSGKGGCGSGGKNCCDSTGSCGDLKKHENNCCIVVCLNDLENNLPQGTMSQTD